MFKTKDYEEYLYWWEYWNSKLPQRGVLAEARSAKPARINVGPWNYRERVQRLLQAHQSLQNAEFVAPELKIRERYAINDTKPSSAAL